MILVFSVFYVEKKNILGANLNEKNSSAATLQNFSVVFLKFSSFYIFFYCSWTNRHVIQIRYTSKCYQHMHFETMPSVCVYVCNHLCIYVHECIHVYLCVCVCDIRQLTTHTCICAQKNTQAYIIAYTHMHTHL